MVKKLIFVILLCVFIISALLSSCEKTAGKETTTPESTSAGGESTLPETTEALSDEYIISSVYELNTEPEEIDSHADLIKYSSLENDYRSYTVLDSSITGVEQAYYPRLKILPDGTYMLIYMDGRWGPNVYYMTSRDLENWSEPVLLFGKQSINSDPKLFANGEAVVLKNGDILAFACYRSSAHYAKKVNFNGLCMRRSSDNGKTWSELEIIYVGTVWEPHPLQLDTGEVQLYLTHVAPYISLYGYNTTLRSTGAAIIRSFDDGKSWTPDVKDPPYAAFRVMQAYIGMFEGHRYFKDQMPVAIQLNNGSIALACEACDLNQNFYINIGHSYDNWAKELGLEEDGPADKIVKLNSGVGPYLAQFKSGETLLSYTTSSIFRVKMGNSKAKNWTSKTVDPFSGLATGLWGSLTVLSDHTVFMTSDYQPKPSSDQSVASKITYSTGVLNHAVNAKKMTPAIDAGKKDWEDNTDALFVGSKSQAQMTLRTAYDDNYVYLLIERLDYYLNSEGDSAAVFFSNDRKSKTYYKLTLDCNGSPLLEINRDGKFREINLTGIRSSFGINGTVDNDAQMDKGFVYEIAIPRAEIEFANDYILINIIMQNKDGAKKSPSDTFENASVLDIETWIPAMFR